MAIKAAFFDIDGTILPFGQNDLNPEVKDALHILQRNGIKIFVATGRPSYYVQEFPGIEWDGMLCFNGSCCLDKKKMIYSSPIPHEDVLQVVSNLKSMNAPFSFATAKECLTSAYDSVLEEYFSFSKHTCVIPDTDVFERKLQEDIYEMMAPLSPEKDAQVLAGTKSCMITRWWDRAFDLGPSTASKALGMEHILSHFHMNREESISFGDGGNDLSMIEYAGIGVAMANAKEEVRGKADYIADSCENNGVVSALKHFQLI